MTDTPVVDLTEEYVAAALAALATAGIQVHGHDTDTDTYLDIHLADPAGDWTLTLSYRDAEGGWLLGEDVDDGPSSRWPIGYLADPAEVSAKVAEIWPGLAGSAGLLTSDQDAPFPGRPGYVTGTCGHAVAGSEWRVGFRECERCPS
jgi:hypothetical protein